MAQFALHPGKKDCERQAVALNVSTIARPSFDVKLVAPTFSTGTYRIFVERSDLLFIQIEGGKSAIIGVLAPFLGPMGILIPLVLWLFGMGKSKVNQKRLEEADPEVLLRENKANFKLHVAEVREAAVEASTFFAQSGKAGRLIFSVRHGEKIKCEFVEAAQMKQAIHLLTPLLNSTLTVNVEWNQKNERFEKKKNV